MSLIRDTSTSLTLQVYIAVGISSVVMLEKRQQQAVHDFPEQANRNYEKETRYSIIAIQGGEATVQQLDQSSPSQGLYHRYVEIQDTRSRTNW